jgi:hypothetical protein
MWKDLTIMDQPMIQYIRKGKNKEKIGILLAGKIGGEVCMGWSLCHTKKDTFDLFEGMGIAEDRCFVNERFEKYLDPDCVFDIFDVIPQSIHYDVMWFTERMRRYYKDSPKSELVKFFFNF